MSLKINYVHGQKLITDTDYHARYLQYKNDCVSNVSNPDKLAVILDNYLDYAKDYEKNNLDSVPVRSKYYSSILEEHPVLVFETHVTNLVANLQYNFHLGSEECTIFSGANTKCNRRHESKNIDFAFCVKTNEFPNPVLLVGYEVKKYLDKTMYDSVVHTHELLRTFRPSSIYGFMGEDEARGKEVIANSMMAGKEFILTGKERKGGDRHKINEDIYTKWHKYTLEAINKSVELL